ncbi:MAG: hypothetical protein WBA57_13090 [Elainellaceae cyanobacterium]
MHSPEDAPLVNSSAYPPVSQSGPVDIQREINKLEETILDSPRIPLSHRTLVNEDQLLYQLDLVRLALPTAFQEALELIRHKDELLIDAERYARDIIEAAQRQAAQILDETGLVRQAELEAHQIRQRVQQECDAVREQTLAEIEHLRRQAQMDLEDVRQMAIAESEDIQRGADEYADGVLRDMEQQLSEMVRVIRNGRQHLQLEPSSPKSLPNNRSEGHLQRSTRPGDQRHR